MLLTGMANSFKQRKALVLRTLMGFPAKSLEKRLELECSRSVEVRFWFSESDVVVYLPLI